MLAAIVGHLPVVGQVWWLLLWAAIDKSDEYTLCNFIVGLRVSHFLTLGIGAALRGCATAYLCALSGPRAQADAGGACLTLTPTLASWWAAFWLVQLVVAFRAHSLLPRSAKKGQRRTFAILQVACSTRLWGTGGKTSGSGSTDNRVQGEGCSGAL